MMRRALIWGTGTLLFATPLVVSAQPGPAGVEFAVNSYSTLDQRRPRVCKNGAGDFVAVWDSNGQDGNALGVFGRRFDGAGTPLGADFQVNTYTTNSQDRPAVCCGSGDTFAVVWRSVGQDGNGDGIFGRAFDGAGPVGSEFQVNAYTTGAQSIPDVACDSPGNFVAAWNSPQDGDADGIVARRFNAGGTPQAGEFQVNSYTTSTQTDPAVAVDSDGDFVVAWRSDGQDGSAGGVVGRRFDSTGAAQGSEFVANTYTTGDQLLSDVGAAGDGRFVVVWRSSGQDGDGYGIFGQRYDSAGAAAGTEFAVNSYTTMDQNNPAVAMDGAGNLVAVWESTDQDGSDLGIFARRWDSTGAPQGGEFQANSYTTYAQSLPAVAADAGGNFILVWQGPGQDGDGTGILAQRFVDPLTLISAKKIVITDSSTVPTRRRIIFLSRDTNVDTTTPAGIDPTADGAALQIYNAAGTGDAVCFQLPAGNWAAKGNPANPVYKYKDKTFTNGPCKVDTVKDGRILKARCLAKVTPIDYTLDEPSQGMVAMRFTSGTTEYCAVLGGQVVKDLPNSRFIARNAPVPDICPATPVLCAPSGPTSTSTSTTSTTSTTL